MRHRQTSSTHRYHGVDQDIREVARGLHGALYGQNDADALEAVHFYLAPRSRYKNVESAQVPDIYVSVSEAFPFCPVPMP